MSFCCMPEFLPVRKLMPFFTLSLKQTASRPWPLLFTTHSLATRKPVLFCLSKRGKVHFRNCRLPLFYCFEMMLKRLAVLCYVLFLTVFFFFILLSLSLSFFSKSEFEVGRFVYGLDHLKED